MPNINNIDMFPDLLRQVESGSDQWAIFKFGTGRFWKLYIEHEMKQRSFDKVEKLFQKCLIKVLHIDLWRCYLNYVKETKGNQPSFREKMAQAYDFALDKIGIDYLSYPIWNDYVNFLKNVEAMGSYAENQKITAVRRVYQRGVINPMINIEAFWKDYISYEQGINMMIAEKMIADRSRDYMNARRVAKEYEAKTRGLNRNAVLVPPSWTADDMKQVEIWRKYILWEKSNPLRTEDMSLIIKRVVFAYEQALLCLGLYPDIWYEYAYHLEENAKLMSEKGDMNQCRTLQDEAAAVYDRATTTLLKSNILIHFAYADFEEGRNKKDKANEIYLRLLDNKDETLNPTLVYIQYMKFARRSEGIKTARLIFKRAREDFRSGYQIYTAAALMEYYCSKDKTVACKIFELGLKKFSDNPSFILTYIDFLSHLNEENNTRVLFERVLTSGSLPPEMSGEIWNRFLEFESNIGDLSSVIKVEKRRAQAISSSDKIVKSSETACLVDRYKFLDLLPITTHELKCIGYCLPKSGPSVQVMSPGNDIFIEVEKNKLTKPDFTQMIPFKPKINSIPGAHAIPGGIFPPPPAIGSLLAHLPHPGSFKGPFVSIDELMSLFRSALQIPTASDYPPPKPEGITGSTGVKLFETAVKASANMPSVTNSPVYNDKNNSVGIKRPAGDEEDDLEPDNSNSNPPTFDVYRARQLQKRVK